MSRIIGLFGNQNDAEYAVKTLADSNLSEYELQTIDEWMENDGVIPIPTSLPGAQPSGVSTPGMASAPLLGLNHDQARFVKRSIEQGGVLVVIDLEDDADISHAKDLMEEQGAQLVTNK